MFYIGLMSGTSMDAIDAALVEFGDHTVNLVHYLQHPIDPGIQATVRAIHAQSSQETVTGLDVLMGELFAAAVHKLLDNSGCTKETIAAIGSHGQTVLHLPLAPHPRSMQIGDPNIIALRTDITTIADFRRMDIAAGGQGAPLAPAFHNWYLPDRDATRVVLNIGGMANITILPADMNGPVLGFDTGPGNGLMDAWIQRHLQQDYDHDGHWAGSGHVDEALLENLMLNPYFHKYPPKSTGKDDFNLGWIDGHLQELSRQIKDEDVQATLLELTTQTIGQDIDRIAGDATEVLLCGGGIHNRRLIERLRGRLPGRQLNSTAVYGINPDAIEAITFAWLAKCRLDNLPGNLTSVTGANKSVLLGGIYQA